MPWNEPGPDVRHALRDRLLVDVDPVPVPGGEHARVARGLREADQHERAPPRRRSSAMCSPTMSRSGSSGVGRPRGTSPTSATPWSPRSRSEPTRAARRRPGRAHPGPTARRTAARGSRPARRRRRATVAQWMSPSELSQDAELPPRVVPLGRRAGQLGQLADDDVDGGAGEEPGDDRLREEPGDPAQPQRGEQRGTAAPVSSAIAATSCAA